MKFYIIYLLITAIISFLLINELLTNYQTEHYVAPQVIATTTAKTSPKLSVVKRNSPTPTQIALINKYAQIYNVSTTTITNVISCESDFIETARGDGGYSRGLVQIHSQFHPEVTYEQATNPEFAINFLAEKLSKNQGYLWTCYKLLARANEL